MKRPHGPRTRGLSRLLPAIAAALLVAAACGGDDEAGETPTATSATDTPTSTPDSGGPTMPSGDPGAPEFRGTLWRVTDYLLPSGAMTNVWDDTEVTMEFDSDGSVSGSGGCNQYGASYEVEGDYDEFQDGVRDPNDGQVMRISSLTATEMACTPDRIMEQENDFFEILAETGRWVMIRGSLHLRTADGLFLLEAEPAE